LTKKISTNIDKKIISLALMKKPW